MELLNNCAFTAIWSIPVLLLIIFVGVYLTVRSRMAQFRLLPAATRHLVHSFQVNSVSDDGISGYRALCTALAATVGTGNIAGVAGAIAIGGPGVIFWMWICGLLGMILKFAEVTLSIHFRQKDPAGNYIGGPMYMILNGLQPQLHFLAYIYCYLGIVAALGVGNAAQINAVVDGFRNIGNSMGLYLGTGCAFLIGTAIVIILVPVFKQGAVGVGRLAEKLVPVASIVYIAIAIVVITIRGNQLPNAFRSIIRGAFTPSAVTGGMITSSLVSLRVGVSRGIFTNEAGMGTASVAHASSNVKHPVEQGLMGIMEVFLDTVVICTLTALVILTSEMSIPYGNDPGVTLTMNAFASVLGNWSRLLLTVLSCIFAFATILGWGLYGMRFCQFLFGLTSWKYFLVAQSLAVILGSMLGTSTIWGLSEFVNGLMTIPNLIAVFMLSGNFLKLLKEKAYSH